jgi:hypothetical protein
LLAYDGLFLVCYFGLHLDTHQHIAVRVAHCVSWLLAELHSFTSALCHAAMTYYPYGHIIASCSNSALKLSDGHIIASCSNSGLKLSDGSDAMA